MEPCEMDYILKNLFDLASITLCDCETLNILLGKGVITNEEYKFLSAKNLSHGSMPAATELYQIAITRLNGYNLLLDALYKSGQTGAVSLLLDAPFGVNPPVQMVEAQAMLLQGFEAQIFDKKFSFKEIFPNLSTEELTEILSDVNLNKEFRNLQRTSEPLLILQKYTPPSRPFYIPRSISNRLLLKEELFKCKEIKDVFVFRGIGWKVLTELINPHLLQSSTYQRWSITCRHIFLEHEDDWNEILKRAKTPVHLIHFDGENYVLQNSNRTTKILLQYSYRSDKLPYVTEDEFIAQILAERNGALLCDVPGMGKTWLMESIAKKVQSVSTDRIVFFIALPLLAKHLEEKQRNMHCNNNLAMILEYACKSKFVASVIYASGDGDENQSMLVFVCDGFDEIMESSVEETTSFLKDLRSKTNVKLVISSRPYKRKYLETSFELASFDILPLSPEEQISFLCQHWQRKLGSVEQSQQQSDVLLEKFASQCINSFQVLKGDPLSKLLGTPLICSLLAVINEENARSVSALSRNRPVVVPENIIVNSISELYEVFVNFCLKNLPKEQQETAISHHTYYALQLLFPEVAAAYIRLKQLETIDLFMGRVGIISQNGEFLHRSFAEYFVGRVFAEFYKDVSAFDTEFASLVVCQFIHTIWGSRVSWMDALLSMHRFRDSIFSRLSLFRYRVQYPVVLHFMNAEFSKGFNEQALSHSVENLSQTHLKMLKSLICSSLNEFLFVNIHLNLENLLSFYVNWIKILFSTDEERIASVTEKTSLETYSMLLCFAAGRGSPATVNSLFTLYNYSEGNWLASKFTHYIPSDKQQSPLEIAIERKDIDLVECFYGKVMMIPDRLYKACLSVDNFRLNAENDDKILRIMDRVLPAGNEICRLTQERISERRIGDSLDPKGHNLRRLLIKFAYMRRMSLTSLEKRTKVNVTRRIMETGNDQLFLKTLLLLFHKDTFGKSNCTFETGINNDQHLTKLPADKILSLLNITAVKETLVGPYIESIYDSFANITGLETLKVLLAICPTFTDIDEYKRNYMHLAVHQNKLDWVGYLIKMGHDVKQQDTFGKTPLLSVSTKTEPEIVTCLVESGADIYVVKNDGGNFLHCLLSPITTEDLVFLYFPNFSPHFFSTWINFIFNKKFNKLFEMKNLYGLTPISLLAQNFKEEADLVFSMYGEYQFMPREFKAALLERTILWYDDGELIKLLVKMFPVGENLADSDTDNLRLLNNSDALAFNLTDAKETAQNVLISEFIKITQPFQYIKNTETLKILLKIIPNFSCRNVEQLNYMHISVAQGKVEWLEHLIALGHDVNQQDKGENTPVFYLSENNAMVTIRLLVKKRANLNHINFENETFANVFLMKDIPEDVVIQWTRYMLEIGAHAIWHIESICNETPPKTAFELLSGRLGNDHPTTGEVFAAAPLPSGSNNNTS